MVGFLAPAWRDAGPCGQGAALNVPNARAHTHIRITPHPNHLQMVRANDVALSEPVYVVRSTRIAGEASAYQELMRRLLGRIAVYCR